MYLKMYLIRAAMVAALIATPTALQAQVLTAKQAFTVTPDGGSWTFDKFLSSLGTLKKVHMTFNVSHNFLLTVTGPDLKEPEDEFDLIWADQYWTFDTDFVLQTAGGEQLLKEYKQSGGGGYFEEDFAVYTTEFTNRFTPTLVLTDDALLTRYFTGAGQGVLYGSADDYGLVEDWYGGWGSSRVQPLSRKYAGEIWYEYTPTVPVPEPGSALLVTSGLAWLFVVVRRRRA